MARKKTETVVSEAFTEEEGKAKKATGKQGGKAGKTESVPEEQPAAEQEEAVAEPEEAPVIAEDTVETVPEACEVSADEACPEASVEPGAEPTEEPTDEPEADSEDLSEEAPESEVTEEEEPVSEYGEEPQEDAADDSAVGTELAVVRKDEPVDMSEIASAIVGTGKVVAIKCASAAKIVGVATKNAVKTGARNTSDYCKTRRLNRMIADEQLAMDGICAQIGKLVYQDFLNGVSFREEIEELCRSVQMHEMEIPPIRLERAKMHRNTICKECGAEMSEDAAFCPACGAATAVTPEIPEKELGEEAYGEVTENPEAAADEETAAAPEMPEAVSEGTAGEETVAETSGQEEVIPEI